MSKVWWLSWELNPRPLCYHSPKALPQLQLLNIFTDHFSILFSYKMIGVTGWDWTTTLCTTRPTCYHTATSLPQLQLLNIYTDHFSILFSSKKIGDTAKDWTTDLCTTRPTCYHTATTLPQLCTVAKYIYWPFECSICGWDWEWGCSSYIQIYKHTETNALIKYIHTNTFIQWQYFKVNYLKLYIIFN